jgi:hypothetical protein
MDFAVAVCPQGEWDRVCLNGNARAFRARNISSRNRCAVGELRFRVGGKTSHCGVNLCGITLENE